MQYTKSKLLAVLQNIPRSGWTWQKIKDLVDSLWRDPVNLRWSGFETAGGTDCVISWDTDTLTITPNDPDDLGPLLPSFAFYQFRRIITYHVKGAAESITVETMQEGLYIFYYDYSETIPGVQELKYIYNPTDTQRKDIYLHTTVIAHIYYDAANNEALHFGNDRHGSEWNAQIHWYLHNAFRARRKSGLQFTGYSLNGDGSLNDHAKFNITGGVMLHDDFEMTIPTSSNSIPVLYSFGTYPRFLANNGYAFASAGRVYYNSGQISLAQADSGNYVLYHIFATNEILTASRKIISVMGTAQYTTLADAFQGVDPELDGIVTYMPQQGRCYLGSIIIQTSDDYTNDVKARIVALTGNQTHPPVSIAPGSEAYLSMNEKQELAFDADAVAESDIAIKVAIDFVDNGELEFVYNCPVALKFTSQESEGADAAISPALNTDMAQYGKVTITAAEVGLIVLNGVTL